MLDLATVSRLAAAFCLLLIVNGATKWIGAPFMGMVAFPIVFAFDRLTSRRQFLFGRVRSLAPKLSAPLFHLCLAVCVAGFVGAIAYFLHLAAVAPPAPNTGAQQVIQMSRNGEVFFVTFGQALLVWSNLAFSCALITLIAWLPNRNV